MPRPTDPLGQLTDLVAEASVLCVTKRVRIEWLLREALKRFIPSATGLRLICNEIHPSSPRFAPIRLAEVGREPKMPTGFVHRYTALAVMELGRAYYAAEKRLKAFPEEPVVGLVSELYGSMEFQESGLRREVLNPVGTDDVWTVARNTSLGYVIALFAPRPIGAPRLPPEEVALLVALSGVLVGPAVAVAERPRLVSEGLQKPYDLSGPQTRVLGYALAGLSEGQIALRLDRSPHTVHGHLRELYKRFRVSGRAELLALHLDELEGLKEIGY